jgi:hypothetical protein
MAGPLVHMSQRSSTRDANPLAPTRRTGPERMSSSGPDDRVASSGDVAIFFREDCRTLRDFKKWLVATAERLERRRS